MCTPTRTSIQSGRLPVHVNTGLGSPCDDNTGIPRNMTGFAEHLQRAGYKTHFAGKWDAGMATPKHTPHGRGYQKSLHYFHHTNDYWNNKFQSCGKTGMVDLWDTTGPAHGQQNSPHCSQKNQNGCKYEEQLFADSVISAIEKRDHSKPLFIFWAVHSVHVPLQVPDEYLHKFSFIT